MGLRGELVELSGYFRIVRRWWLVLVASVVLAGVGGYAVASRLPKLYEAEVRILVGPLNTDLNTQRAAGQLANTYAQLASSARVTDAVIARLGLDMRSSDLQNSISATANDVTRLVVVRVQNSFPQTAATLANAVADQLGVLSGISSRVEGQVTVVDPAVAPAIAVAPQVSLLVLLAAFAGLLAAIMCIVLIEYARDLVTSEHELRELSGSPMLGRVSTRAYRAHDVPSALLSAESGEQYRALAARIEHAFGVKRVGAMLVAGVTSHEHAGIVATGIALALADRGIPTALVDANAQHPEATHALGLRPDNDLAGGVAAGQVPMARLTLVAGGTPEAESRSVRLAAVPSTGDRDLSRVEDLKRLLDAVRSTADVIVITTPPVDQSPEVAMWAGLVDAIVMVAPLPGTKRREVVAGVEALRLSGRAYTGTIVTESARRPLPFRRRHPNVRQFSRVVSQVVAAVTPPRAATARARTARKPPQ
jgi:capsular polysaccharide biosynthesis protein/Mrp family chromosome partitioning ATPase